MYNNILEVNFDYPEGSLKMHYKTLAEKFNNPERGTNRYLSNVFKEVSILQRNKTEMYTRYINFKTMASRGTLDLENRRYLFGVSKKFFTPKYNGKNRVPFAGKLKTSFAGVSLNLEYMQNTDESKENEIMAPIVDTSLVCNINTMIFGGSFKLEYMYKRSTIDLSKNGKRPYNMYSLGYKSLVIEFDDLKGNGKHFLNDVTKVF